MGNAYYGECDRELEKASDIALANCTVCLDSVGLAWYTDGMKEILSMCWECGLEMQEEEAAKEEDEA